jgi:MoaA/NifB/PqqE/SkfB family radical SAM enzyme
MGLKYTKMKIFHYKEKLDSLPRNRRILSPVHIRIKPTNVCNHSCRYCAYRVENLQLGKDMSARDYIPGDKMTEIIKDLRDMGVKAVTFSGGGEPFCYPHLSDAVKQLINSGIKFACLTNGSLLTGELAEAFAHNAAWLRVSMDGWDDDSYRFYRKTAGKEFTRIIRNMEQFKRLNGSCDLGVSLIVDKHNAGHVHEFIKNIRAAGADSVKISPCIISNSGAENNDYHKSVFDKVKEGISRSKSDFAGDDFEIFDAYHFLDEKFVKSYNWCPYLQILPVIGADLNVYPCQDKAYNLDEGLIGSIKDRTFKDFWFSDKANFFKVDPSKVCGHHCVANEKNKLILEYLDSDAGHLEFV